MSSKKYKYKQKNKPVPPVPPIGHPPYNVNGEGGRPKKWDEKALDELTDRLDEWLEKAIASKKEFWWQDWAFEVGIDPNKVTKYASENPRFKKSYERAKAWQSHIVQKGAIHKQFSEGFSKFFLINRFPDDWRSDKYQEENKFPPRDEITELENQNMLLKAEIEALKANNDKQSQARQELQGSDPQV